MTGNGARSLSWDALRSLSLVNVLLSGNLAFWLSPTNLYFFEGRNRDGLSSWFVANFVGAIGVMGMLLVYRRVAKSRLPISLFGILLTILAIDRFRVAIGLPLSGTWTPRFVILAVLLAVGWAVANHEKFIRVIELGSRLALPLALVMFVTAANAMRGPLPRTSVWSGHIGSRHPPIVWVIFDELDQGWLFPDRPHDLKLPNFDEFRATCLSCAQAWRPGPETMFSLPALTTGKPVRFASPSSATDVEIDFVGGTRAEWSATPTIFDEMRSRGRTSAVIGFYHNYASMFRSKVDAIDEAPFVPLGFLPSLEMQMWLILPGNLRSEWLALEGPSILWNRAGMEQHLDQTDQQLKDFATDLLERRSEFIFYHCAVPHGPWVFDEKTHRPHFSGDIHGYFGNMVLADQVLGGIVKALKSSGEWDQSTVLLSADHNLRGQIDSKPIGRYVPLLLKLPGEAEPLTDASPMSSLDEAQLLMEVASGKVRSAREARDFLASAEQRLGPRHE